MVIIYVLPQPPGGRLDSYMDSTAADGAVPPWVTRIQLAGPCNHGANWVSGRYRDARA